MANQHFYEQSASSFHREWCGDDGDGGQMSDEEREVAKNAARVEMARADREAADYRKQEREDWPFFANPDPIFDDDPPF